jgi:hypothetical protein
MIHISINSRWRVHAVSRLPLPLPAGAVWGQMRDVRRFLTVDPLHVSVEFPGLSSALPEPGAPLTIRHRLLGIGVTRVGRLLTWREGRGYAVSDLSRAGARRGFPHVCAFEVTPVGPAESILSTSARGVWTATWIPRPLVYLWLWWVLAATEVHVKRDMKRFTRWRRSVASHLPQRSPPDPIIPAPPPATPSGASSTATRPPGPPRRW